MTPRKPAPTTVVVAAEPWVLNAAALAAKVGCCARTVRDGLVFADGTKATVKDVPAQVDGSEQPQVFFDLGGGVQVAMWKGPNGAICCFRQHAEDAIAEARKRWNHPSSPAGSGR